MPINFQNNVAYCSGVCDIEEAESLLEWVLKKRKPKCDLTELEHMHTAILQVIIAANIELVAAPVDPKLKAILPALIRRAQRA